VSSRSALFRKGSKRTQTTDLFLLEDLEDVGRAGELARKGVNDQAEWVLHTAS
jgi:hypothetical protein